MKTEPFATKLPSDLTAQLDMVCRKLGLRKNFVLETALREKLEDLMDAADLRDAMNEATGFVVDVPLSRLMRKATEPTQSTPFQESSIIGPMRDG